MVTSRVFILAIFWLLRAGPAWATPAELQTFLLESEDALRPVTTLRADGELSFHSPDENRRDHVLLVRNPSGDLYIELRHAGTKALLLGAKAQAFRLAKGEKQPKPFPRSEALFDSDFTREDLEPFSFRRYGPPSIADQSEDRITLTLYPKDSQYSLLVATFDRRKKVPLKILYYRKTLSNLVKMRRASGHALVGRMWLPTVITMEDFQIRTRTELKLTWRQEHEVGPELFDPAFLIHSSGLTWPDTPRGLGATDEGPSSH